MAFLQDTEEEEKQAQPGSMNQTAAITGQAAPAAPQAGPQGSGHVNQQKYVDANKPKAQQMNQAVTQGLTGTAGQLTKDIGKDVDAFDRTAKKEEDRIGAGGWQAPGQENVPDLSKGPGDQQPIASQPYAKPYVDTASRLDPATLAENKALVQDDYQQRIAKQKQLEALEAMSPEELEAYRNRPKPKYDPFQIYQHETAPKQDSYYQQLIDKAGSGTLTDEEKARFKSIRENS